ncbi:MAG: hypoxanthine phosphoribosyltransferase [Ruminococcus sp.]|nr:hypoxanthine phosphoribosyltransferase [Ruminococcus sp.]
MKITDESLFQSKIKGVLITEDEIKEKISQVAKEINERFASKPLLLISILKGSFVFLSDLMREIKIPCEVAFMAAKSYFDETSPRESVQITLDIDRDISEYNVIIVEDIIDTGRTLKEIVKILERRKPLSLSVITLLDKPSRRLTDFNADCSLFTIEDRFVIGYGLDYGEYYRNLPYIAELSE